MHKNLTIWTAQRVFLLNAVLTVIVGKSNSHQKTRWEEFSKEAIRKISKNYEKVVFLQWGKKAQEIATLETRKTLRRFFPSVEFFFASNFSLNTWYSLRDDYAHRYLPEVAMPAPSRLPPFYFCIWLRSWRRLASLRKPTGCGFFEYSPRCTFA